MSLLNLSISGEDRLEKIITVLDQQKVLDQILDEGAAVLFNRMRERFLRETDPDGNKWPRSKAAEDRERTGRGGGTLYNTGRLWASIQLYTTGPNSRAIGTDVPYGKFHQFGTIHLPRRQFLGFADEDVTYMEQLAIKRIGEALA